jgi:hypothetical protein
LLGPRCGWEQDRNEDGKAGNQKSATEGGLQAKLRMCHGAPSPIFRPERCTASTSWLAPGGGGYGHWNCVGKAGNRAAQNAAQLSGPIKFPPRRLLTFDQNLCSIYFSTK